MSYIAQTKTITGTIFHYVDKDHMIESKFYTDEELDQFAKE